MLIETTVNGVPRTLEVAPSDLLLDVLRDRLGLTGAKRSCDVQVCGTCTVLLDGVPVSACTTLAHEARGRRVMTIEGLAETPGFARLEEVFEHHNALQCGYCTSGMALTITSLLEAGELADDEDVVREALSGNVCRCTGYRAIIDAARELAR
ncbi:MAG: 2Fe-2S iron-sulfur cluster binding domain-containing protein [Thermoleophilia bacterium]|nr:2Fe-2S iron-sulfur cluster binding domain-containing protein [Thermoleophilia bacterium]